MKPYGIADAERPRTAPQFAIVMFAAFTLLSYPFFFKFFAHSAYQLGFAALFVVAAFMFVLRPELSTGLTRAPEHAWLSLAMSCYGAYVLWLGIASMLGAGETYLLADFIRLLLKLASAALLFLIVPMRVYRWTLDRYLDVMSAAAVAGIVLVVALVLTGAEPAGILQLPSAGVRDDGIRQVYLLGLVWGYIALPSGERLTRLQSFSDEPGTFAFALLIAMIWGAYRQRRFALLATSSALLLTWSLGAVIAAALIGIVRVARRSVLRAAMLMMVALMVSGVAWTSMRETPSGIVLQQYLATKFGRSENTSMGDRVQDVNTLMVGIAHRPGGLGAGAVSHTMDLSLGVGWLRVLGESGFVGFTFYALALGSLTLVALACALARDGEVAALGTMVVVLAFAALQRTRMDESVWHWWILIGFVKGYLVAVAPVSTLTRRWVAHVAQLTRRSDIVKAFSPHARARRAERDLLAWSRAAAFHPHRLPHE